MAGIIHEGDGSSPASSTRRRKALSVAFSSAFVRLPAGVTSNPVASSARVIRAASVPADSTRDIGAAYCVCAITSARRSPSALAGAAEIKAAENVSASKPRTARPIFASQLHRMTRSPLSFCHPVLCLRLSGCKAWRKKRASCPIAIFTPSLPRVPSAAMRRLRPVRYSPRASICAWRRRLSPAREFPARQGPRRRRSPA